MDFGPILKELGLWGSIALIGSMGFTEVVKRSAKAAGAKVPWRVWMAMPSLIAIVFVAGMVRGGKLEREMALLVWAGISFAGPLIYAYVIKPALRVVGKGK